MRAPAPRYLKPEPPCLNILILHSDLAMREWLASVAATAADSVVSLPSGQAPGPDFSSPDLIIAEEAGPEPFCGQWRANRRRGRGAYILALLPAGADALAILDAGADDYAAGEPSDALAVRIRVARRAAADRVQRRSRLRDGVALFESISFAVIAFGLDSRIRWVNTRATLESGYSREEMVGQPVQRFLSPGANFDEGAIIAEALKSGRAQVETELVGAEGETAYARIVISPIHSEGELAGFLTIVEDIGVQKRALLELEQSRELFQSVFSQTLAGVVVSDSDGFVVWVNDAALRILGRPRQAVIGQSVALGFPESWREDLLRAYRASIAAPGPIAPIDVYVSRPDGTRSYVTMTRATFHGPADQAYGVTTMVDITALKDAQEETARLAAIIESTDEAIISRDLGGRIISWNKGAERLYGFTAEETIGTMGVGHVPEGQAGEIDWQIAASSRGEVHRVETVRRRKDGSLVDVSLAVFPVYDERGRVRAAAGISHDITARKQAEEARRLAEQQRQTVTANAPVILFAIDPDGRFTLVEGAALSALGVPPGSLVGLDAASIFADAPAIIANIARAMVGETFVDTADFLDRTWQVSHSPIRDENGAVTGSIGVATDVTELRRAEQALVQAQKLESLGILAGGVAHDFNNLLVGILGNAGLALMDLAPTSPLYETVKDIERAGQRAAELARQMLAYSGKGKFVVQQIDLNELVGEMSQLLRASIGRGAELQHQFTPGLPPVYVDATQIRQVVMNLVVNASDALTDGKGAITMTTGLIHARPGELESAYYSPDFIEGDYVFLDVADTGRGMPAETLERIFDPFFTTKFTGRGLGLAAALGIVRGHRGAIRVWSEPGEGSRFVLLLPAAIPLERASAGKAMKGPASVRATGAVIVIDDEPMVRSITSRALATMGYAPLAAASGEEGLAVIDARAPIVEAVLLDMTMPGMDGAAVLAAIRQRWPVLPVILMSGYSEQVALERVQGTAVSGFIQKPYDLDTLRRALAAALDPAPASGLIE